MAIKTSTTEETVPVETAPVPDAEGLEVPEETPLEPSDFDDLLDLDEGVDGEEVPEETPEEVPEETAPAETTPEEVPAETTPVTPETETPPAEAEPSPLELLTNEYTEYFSEDSFKEFETNPREFLIKFAAQMHHAVYASLAEGFTNALPQQIEQVTAQSQEQSQFRQDFFKSHPHLNDPKYTDPLAQTLNLYVQQNPQSSRDEIIKAVGQIATISLGLTPAATPAAPKPAPSFTPAAPGGNGPASTGSNLNEFEAFFDDLQEG